MQWQDYKQALHAEHHESHTTVDPAIEKIVHEIIGRIADKWTMLTLEALEQEGTVRFTQLGKKIPGISQKMLTKTLRQMESDGLVKRVVYPVVPPCVEYSLTTLGYSLGSAFCGVWLWAEAHHRQIEEARRQFALVNQNTLNGK